MDPPRPPGGGDDTESASELLRRAFARSPLGRLGPAAGSAATMQVVLAGGVAAAVYLGALPALAAYQVPLAPALIVGAAAGSTAVATVSARALRLPAPLSYAASLGALVLLLLAADGPHPAGVLHALEHGPNRLLTETLPLSGPRVSLSAIVVLTWAVGAATAELLVRGRVRGRASRPAAPAALVLPVALYTLLFALCSSAQEGDPHGAPLLLIALAVTAALHRQVSRPAVDAAAAGILDPAGTVPAPRRSPLSPVLSALVAAAAVAVAVVLIAPAVPALDGPPDAVHRTPPIVTPVITDPVDVMAALRDGNPDAPPATLLTAALSAPSTGYLAVADLDSYDGGEWRFNATFQPSGGRIPQGPVGRLTSNRTVTQHIEIDRPLPVPLLPSLDRPVSLSGIDVVVDAADGMLIPQDGAGEPGYAVVSETPDVGLNGLSAADPLDPAVARPADLSLPPDTAADLATTVRFVSTLTGQRPAPTVAFLQAVLQTLQSKEKRIVPSAGGRPAAPAGSATRRARPAPTTTTTQPPGEPGGTSLSEVIDAVTVVRAATPEEFATFYAMVARYLGVPARLVTGFRVAPGSSGPPVGPGVYRVTNRQAWAWVEIPVTGFGWVVCDPTPDAATTAAAPPPESVQAPATTLPPRQADAVPRSQIVGGHALAPPGHVVVPGPPRSSAWAVATWTAIATVVALVLAGPGQAALRRGRRRRRRRSGDPAAVAVGAWLELLDGLNRAGMRTRPGATSSEVAAEVGLHFGTEAGDDTAVLAATADRAIFSTSEPLPAGAAEAAWVAQRLVRRRIMAGLDRRQRIRSTLLVGTSPGRPTGDRR